MSSSTEVVSYDLVIKRNRDFVMNAYFKDSAGDAVDLTDWTGFAQIREELAASSTLILTMEVTIADAAAGKVTIFASDAITGVTQDKGYWDLLMVDPSGIDDSYIIGHVTFIDVPTVKS